MRITAAAQLLGISPRMLRYREFLGLLPSVRTQGRRQPVAARKGAGALQADKAWQARAALAPDGPRPPGRVPAAGSAGPASAAGHRQFGSADLDAVALGLAIEQRYDISPAALAFGVRVLADPRIRADVAELGRRIGRIQPPPARALDFEKERAQRLLGLAGPVQRTAAPPAHHRPPRAATADHANVSTQAGRPALRPPAGWTAPQAARPHDHGGLVLPGQHQSTAGTRK